MGFWGEHMFQSDRDLDVLDELAAILGIDSLYYPEDPDRVCQQLNTRNLKDVFKELRTTGADPASCMEFYGIKLSIIILAAAAMGVGADITDEDRAHMKNDLKSRIGLHEAATRDMSKALDEYQNGVPYHIGGKDLLTTADDLL